MWLAVPPSLSVRAGVPWTATASLNVTVIFTSPWVRSAQAGRALTPLTTGFVMGVGVDRERFRCRPVQFEPGYAALTPRRFGSRDLRAGVDGDVLNEIEHRLPNNLPEREPWPKPPCYSSITAKWGALVARSDHLIAQDVRP
jgi:hypothetical protein